MSDLVGNPEDRFSHNEAHLLYLFTDVESNTSAKNTPFRTRESE